MTTSQQAPTPATAGHTPVRARLEWIDVAKGIAITLVVLGHVVWVLSLLELPTSDFWRRILSATGAMRMPGFFLMSGLFANKFISGTLERFARRRVIGFVYLFIVWMAITAAIEVGLGLWLGATADAVSRSNLVDHILWLETPMWYLIALPAFHLLWWATRRMPTWMPLAFTGVGYLTVELGSGPLPGMLSSTGYRGMIHYALFFMIGARLSQPLRDIVGRMTPWAAAAIVGLWLATEFFAPTMSLKALVAVPALFALSQLIARTPLKSLAQRAGRRTLPLYLMNWLAVAIVGGVWLQFDVASNGLTQFLVPAVTLPVVIAIITAVWHLTRDVEFLWGPPKPVEDGIIRSLQRFNNLEPGSSSLMEAGEPLDGTWTRPEAVSQMHAHRSLDTITR